MILSLPPVAGACFLKMLKILSGKVIIENWPLMAIGCLFSFICGLCSLAIVNEFFKKHTMLSIVIYRIIFGIFVAIHSNIN
jgi:undecaprenyl pyrophosphate phosphatase UppP